MNRLPCSSCLVLGLVVAAAWLPADAAAQRRGGRHAPRSVVFAGARSFYPYYPAYYDPFFWGGYGWYPYGLAGFGPAPYYYSGYTTNAHLQVTPNRTEVFVDGYFAGVADDFDGLFQRLTVPTGEHEIELHLEGHRTYRQKVLFRPDSTFKLRHVMEPLAPGEAAEPRPSPSPTAAPPAAPGPAPMPRPPAPPYGRRERPRAGEQSSFGTLSIRVQPADAEVFVDGERWDGPRNDQRLELQVPEGTHQVEIRKEGFQPFTTSVSVRRGEIATLNVSLPQGGR